VSFFKLSLLIVTILISAAPSIAFAVSPQDFTFQLSPASRELSQQTVRKIFEDSRGFIWFLTQEGLNRFDGYEVLRIRSAKGKPDGLSHQSITAMAEDKNGDFWITTAGGGLNKLSSKNFTFKSFQFSGEITSKNPLSNMVMSIMIANDGMIWLGYGLGAGFSVFDPDEERFFHYPDPDPRSIGIVRDFAQTPDGAVWMAIEDKGLFRTRKERPSLQEKIFIPSKARPNLEVTKFSSLLVDNEGRLWATSLTDGLIGIEASKKSLSYVSHDLQSNLAGSLETYSASEDTAGNIWLGTTSGIHVISKNKESVTVFDTANSNLPDNQVFSLQEGRSGVIWAGTFNGIAYGTNSLFERYTANDGLSSSSVNAFAQTLDGLVWIGNDAGIDVLNPNDEQAAYAPLKISPSGFDLGPNRVMSLIADKNNIWAGTLSAGLFFINRDKETIEHYIRQPGSPDGLNNNGITSLLKLNSGTLLIGTYGGGLNILNTETRTFTSLQSDPSNPRTISNNMVVALFRDTFDNVWVGTEYGLNLFHSKTGEFTRFVPELNTDGSLSSNMAWSINQDSDGNLWVGTQSGGINRLSKKNIDGRKNSFENFDLELPSADVYSILPALGYLWISHNQGISKIDRRSMEVSNFDMTHGLQGPEFNHGAAFQDDSGRLYFGGPMGFNRIDPTKPTFSSFSPPLRLTSVKILNEDVFFDKSYDALDGIIIEHDFDFMSFTFASLDYRNPGNIEYRYRVSGLNEDWINLGANRQISFTRLPHGQYEVMIQGTNSEGKWSENQRNFTLTVTPPLWLTWWAYIIYALLAMWGIFLIYSRQKARADKEIRRRRELEEKVKERTADLERARNAAEEATKAKSEFLAAMSHEIRTPMHGMLGMTDLLMQTRLTEQQLQFARSAKTSGEALLSLVNSILDFSKIEAKKITLERVNFDIRKLVEDTCYVLRESAAKKGVDFDLIIAASVNSMYYGDPDKCRQVITNLVGNAIKFTHTGGVCVYLDSSCDLEDFIYLRVVDTGIGIDTNTREKIFESFTQADTSTTRQYGGTGLGLTITRELVTLMKGSIQIDSEIGVGSTFSVKMPMEKGETIAARSDLSSRPCFALFSEKTEVIDSCTEISKFLKFKLKTFKSFEETTAKFDAILVDFESGYDYSEVQKFALNETKVFLIANSTDALPRIEEEEVTILLRPLTTQAMITVLRNSLFEQAESRPEISAQSRQSHSKPAVLVVEDVKVNQEIVTSMLELLGVQVVVADDGKEALARLSGTNFDLILMDCQMPRMDGFETTRTIRKQEIERGVATPTPIVALTAGGDSAEREAAIESGMSAYIMKPFSIDDLDSALKTHVPGYSSGRNNEPASEFSPVELAENAEILDRDVISRIMELESRSSRPLLQSLILGFRNQSIEKQKALRKAIETNDKDEIRKSAHAIKSMAANVGAVKITRDYEKIEKEALGLGDAWIASTINSLPADLDVFEANVKKLSPMS
jgi:signal transduction histidine kinase/ligand-binding sensor domain-containing protein/CheY-like chemotaxis protein